MFVPLLSEYHVLALKLVRIQVVLQYAATNQGRILNPRKLRAVTNRTAKSDTPSHALHLANQTLQQRGLATADWEVLRGRSFGL